MSFVSFIKGLFSSPADSSKLGEGDRLLMCDDCRRNFVFDAGEQRFFKAKGFTDPKRCPHCRKKVKSHLRKKFRGRQKNGSMFSRRHSLIEGESPYVDER
jgi:hypothetical protein